MKSNFFLLAVLTLFCSQAIAQPYPSFGPEKAVTINGLTFDAMEPFISPDGNTIYFNSLNSGGNTNLYYATRVDDTTFTYVGIVNGTYDPSVNHLDAVASLDSANNFFWVSLRNIPNLYTGDYLAGTVTNTSQVFGTCNIFTPGWIIMDAAISYQGNLLYYSNGYFGPTYTECVGVPCEAKLGVAQKVNDSTFNKTSYSDAIFTNINDTNYLVYAPQITKDGLELYFTRLLEGGFDTEICVSVRNTVADTFSLPMVIHSSYGYFPEGPTPTTDKQKLYYHKKNSSFVYTIYMRYRTGPTAVAEQTVDQQIQVYPNPASETVHIVLPDTTAGFTVAVYTLDGREVYNASGKTSVDMTDYPAGVYFLTVSYADRILNTRIVKD